MIMTREESKAFYPILQAFAEGKVIECRTKPSALSKSWQDMNEWTEMEELEYWNNIEYRIKPEPTYRPFKDAEECWLEMQKHQPFGWVKWNDVRYNIYVVSSTSVCLINGNCENMDFAYAYQKLTFADGTPFGVKEE